jgi:NADH-quinone oxidoreductase subunit J
MDLSVLLFFALAALLVLSSLLVVFLRNVVHAAMALVLALLIIAIFFVTLQASMVGVLQVLVYAGAIMVLFLFVIMLLSPALEQPGRAWWTLATLLALLLAGGLTPLLSQSDGSANPLAATELFGSPEMLAKSLFSDFVLPFEIASVLLLVAIIGAVVLAKREH